MAMIYKNILKFLILSFLFHSCNREKQNTYFDYSNCLYSKPKAIFNDTSLYRGYHFEIKDSISIEMVLFKEKLKPPFKSLTIKQEGCDIIKQSFIFEGTTSLIENFYFLGALKEKYIVYYSLAEKLEEIKDIDFNEVKKLDENFYDKQAGKLPVLTGR